MRTIAVIGLGYAGLPVALAFGRTRPGTIGFDVDAAKVERLRAGRDETGAVPADALRGAEILWTADPAELAAASFYVIAVPTPIDPQRRPDLEALRAAGRSVGSALGPGDIVVLESTVYPGVTEELLGPILAEASGLRQGVDFALAYSPERINPGDPAHGLRDVRKVIAAQDAATLEEVAAVYGEVVAAGLVRTPSIRVAEAAKVIENIQRDLNIALVNELAQLFDRIDLDTSAVLEAAGSKWNFHAYRPGLVGGHCIGVDSYYLTDVARAVGFDPEIILAGRRINEGMGAFVAEKTVRLLIQRGCAVRDARVAVLGLTFKRNVPDLRNSRVPGLVDELRRFGVEVVVHDPLVRAADAAREYGLELAAADELGTLDAVVLAVAHDGLAELALEALGPGTGVLVDVMWALDPRSIPAGVAYWRL